MSARHSLWTGLVLLTLVALPISALGEPPAVDYELGDASTFEAGCLPPCMCPVLVRSPLKGTFRLVEVPGDGLVRLYQVTDLDWTMPSVGGSGASRVRGSGTYRREGATLDLQRLVLDLAVDGGESRHYDSGLVGGADAFPALHLPVALHGFFCHDSVYGVDAQPRSTGVPPRAHSSGLEAGPNPFSRGTEIRFTLAAPCRIDLRLYDLAGREVRALARSHPLGAGSHVIAWDGRNAAGAEVAAGVYFASLRGDGRERRAVLVRLD